MSDLATTTDAALMSGPPGYVRKEPIAPLPPPRSEAGLLGWMQQNLFSSPLNIALTIAFALLLVWIVPPLVKFLIIDAVWDGATRADCLARPDHPEMGACWAFVKDRINFFTYGFYPIDERWRVNTFFVLLALGIGWVARAPAPGPKPCARYFFFPL